MNAIVHIRRTRDGAKIHLGAAKRYRMITIARSESNLSRGARDQLNDHFGINLNNPRIIINRSTFAVKLSPDRRAHDFDSRVTQQTKRSVVNLFNLLLGQRINWRIAIIKRTKPDLRNTRPTATRAALFSGAIPVYATHYVSFSKKI